MRKNSDFRAFFWKRNSIFSATAWPMERRMSPIPKFYSHENRNYDFMNIIKIREFYFLAIWTWRWIISCRAISWGSPRLATRLLDPNASCFGSILAMGAISCAHVRIRSCYKPCQKKKSKIKLPFLKRNSIFSTTTRPIELNFFTEKLLNNTRRMSPIPKFYFN